MSPRCLITRFLPTLLFCVVSTHAQSRTDDGDLERLLRNLRDHSRSFRLSLDSTLKKNTIPRSRAKRAEQTADSIEKGSESLLNDFIRTKHGEDKLRTLQRSAQQMHTFVNTYKPGKLVTARWARIETELQQIRAAYGTRSLTPKESSGIKNRGSSGSRARSCLEEAGEERAARLVDRCLEISPATHPPCNSQNPCSLIESEIKRACTLVGTRDAPAYCKEYR